MSDIQTNPEADAPEVEDERDDLVEADELEGEDDESDAEEPEEETDEVDLDGKKYRIPKALKSQLMMQADYTRKTQEVAEQRRELEQRALQQSQTNEAVIKAHAKATLLDERLAEYETVDWDAWENRVSQLRAQGMMEEAQADADALQSAFRTHQRTKEARAGADREIQQAQQAAAFETQRIRAKQNEDGAAYLQKHNIPLTQELADTLVRTGTQFDYSDAELRQISDPRFVRMMHRLHELEKATKTQRVVSQHLKAQEVQPAVKVRGSNPAPPTGLSDKLSDDEWIRRRNAQLAKGRRG
jgi:hypothetical protein